MAHRGNEDVHPQTTHKNYTMIQAFEWNTPGEGKYYKWFTEQVPRLAEMGITAAWIPPPTKASSQDSNGYDIYDIWDLGEFEQKGGVRTKWGTKEELVTACKTAKEHGIVIYIDAVLNHKAGADFKEKFQVHKVDSDDRTKDISDLYDIEGWTGFNFPGRNKKYSDMEWHSHHFTGVDYDDINKETAIFRIEGDGKRWAKNVDKENGSFDYLMFSDIDHAHEEVRNELKRWGAWILKETGAAGFRFDAIKHIDRGFISDFVSHVRKESGKASLFGVGEFWKDSLDSLNNYLNNFGQQFSIFDAPLHYNFKEAADGGDKYDIRKIFDGTLVQTRPIDAVTLVDNHDTQPYESLESWISPNFKPLAYALILLRTDGYPCIFAGDLFGIQGEHTFEPMSQLDDFIKARRYFAYGELHDYWDHPNCVGWVRTGDENHDGCAVVICNGGEGVKRMQPGVDHAGEKWTDVLGWQQGEVTIGDDGWAEFKCPASSVSIWTKSDARAREHFVKK